jgi:CheY-like chemotaxis protein
MRAPLAIGENALETAPVTQSIHVLVVEDSEADALLSTDALGLVRAVERIEVAASAKSALRILGLDGAVEQPFRPDLILLDLHMPVTNGLQLLKILKGTPELAMIPLVIFSGSEDRADVLDAYQSGASAFVRKPDSPNAYADVLRGVIDFWLGVAELPVQSDHG